MAHLVPLNGSQRSPFVTPLNGSSMSPQMFDISALSGGYGFAVPPPNASLIDRTEAIIGIGGGTLVLALIEIFFAYVNPTAPPL